MMQQHMFISEPPSFFIGSRDDDSDDDFDLDKEIVIPSIKLSPPCSGLALRRTAYTLKEEKEDEDSSGSDSGCSLPSSYSASCGINISMWLTSKHKIRNWDIP